MSFSESSLELVYILPYILPSSLLPRFVTAFLLLVGALILFRRHPSPIVKLRLPILDSVTAPDLITALTEFYHKYSKQNKCFGLRLAYHDTIIIPSAMVSEIASLPDKKSSFMKEAYLRFHGKYTAIGRTDGASAHFPTTVRVDLTRNIVEAMSMLYNEIQHSLNDRIGAPDDWKPFLFYETISNVVAQITSRVFVGEELCRHPDWINLMVNYTFAAANGSKALWDYPEWTHPIVALFKKETRLIRDSQKRAMELLAPLLDERKALRKADPDYQPPQDLITWSLKESGEVAWDQFQQAKLQMQMGFASIHTTSRLIAHVVYTLCAYPQYIQPLREEWARVMEEEDGAISKQANLKLRKFDSFFKEVQRMHPHKLVSVLRYAEQDIALSNGTTLPQGAFVAASLRAQNFDPDFYENPDKFDPWRFERMRQESKEADARWQLVTTLAEGNLNFGHGKHACPGRFFAANEMKVLLGHLLAEYDMRFEDPNAARPKDILSGAALIPDPNVKILFRKRKST